VVAEVARRRALHRSIQGGARSARAIRFDPGEVAGFLLRLCAAWRRWEDPADRLAILCLMPDVAPPFLFYDTPALRAWWAEHPDAAIGGVTLSEAEDAVRCACGAGAEVRASLLAAGDEVRAAFREFSDTARMWSVGGAA
jgi:hypothetical protein